MGGKDIYSASERFNDAIAPSIHSILRGLGLSAIAVGFEAANQPNEKLTQQFQNFDEGIGSFFEIRCKHWILIENRNVLSQDFCRSQEKSWAKIALAKSKIRLLSTNC
jgi:hypothetical protein